LNVQILWRLAPLSLAIALAGCGGSDPQFQTLVKSVENLQCEPPRFTPLQLETELAVAGINVRSVSCGWDGLGRVAACGTPSPYLRIIEVPQEQVEAASELGYQSITGVAVFDSSACPQ
jgi:hypothetical protein